MIGATAGSDGSMGLVPTPYYYDSENFLKGDGTWSNTIENSVNASNSDTIDGYHIVVGAEGSDPNTIYFVLWFMAYILTNNARPGGSYVRNIKVGDIETKYIKYGNGTLFYDIQWYIVYDTPIIEFIYPDTEVPAEGGTLKPSK